MQYIECHEPIPQEKNAMNPEFIADNRKQGRKVELHGFEKSGSKGYKTDYKQATTNA